MKKFISLLLTVILLFALGVPAVGADTEETAEFKVSPTEAAYGETLNATFFAPALSKEIAGFEIHVNFDKSVLKVASLDMPKTIEGKSTITSTVESANEEGYLSLMVGEPENFSLTEPITFKAVFEVIGKTVGLKEKLFDIESDFCDEVDNPVPAPALSEDSTLDLTVLPLKDLAVKVSGGKATLDGKEITKADQGSTVTITTVNPDNKQFEKWEVVSGDVDLADPQAETTTFTLSVKPVEIKAIYRDTTAAYKVIHKLQKLDGVTYEEKKVEDMRGNIGELTTAEAENFEGFNAKDFRQVEINADGSTEVIIEYDRTKCTLSFDSKGGSKVNPITVLYEDDASKYYTGDPAKEGFTFKGWYLNPECTGEKYTIGTLKADLTLYAKWEKDEVVQEWTIRFDANGGKGEMKQVTVKDAQEYKLPKCTFTAPEGMHFSAWEVNFGNQKVKHQVGDKLTVKGDLEVKALWEKDEVVQEWTIRFDANGGKGEMRQVTVKDAQEYKLPECTFTAPEGMHFSAWEANFGNQKVKHQVGDKLTVKGDLDVKALWEKEVPTAPETGDNSQLGIWLAIDLAVLSGTAVLLLLAKKRKQA